MSEDNQSIIPASQSIFRRLGLVAPGLTLAALSLPLVVYLPEYYSSTLGMDLALVGTIFMLVRLFDIGFDPIFGGFMDRTVTRFGRYRPWVLLASPMIMIAIGMLFFATGETSSIFLFGWLALAYIGYSVLSLSQLSLISNVSTGYDERSVVYGWWQGAFFIGVIGVMLMPKLLALAGVVTPSGRMASMAWMIIAITPLTAIAAFFAVKEQPARKADRERNMKDYFALMKNPNVQRVLACEALMGVAGGATSALLIFFFTRVKGLDHADTGLLFIAYFIVGFAATPIWTKLAQRMEKHRALAAACLVYCFFLITVLLAPKGNFPALLITQALLGISYGAASMLPRSMIADINDEVKLESGADQNGLLYALLIGTWKIGQAVCVGVMFWALALFGFDPKEGSSNPDSAMLGLILLFVAFPIILKIAAAIVAWRYPLTAARHAEIRQQLDEREAAEAS